MPSKENVNEVFTLRVLGIDEVTCNLKDGSLLLCNEKRQNLGIISSGVGGGALALEWTFQS